MKLVTRWVMIGIMAAMLNTAVASADSFGAYFGSDGWGFTMNFGDYDYYNRYSPGYYDSASFDFRMALNPYGTWQYVPEFGDYVWVPDVPPGWRPYSYGSWSYTSYGWMWTAYEPWGWIPHHYGNWFFHPVFHWIWIPGYTWAPAHVTWGFFNGYYGWAPLPPRHSPYYTHYRQEHRYDHRHPHRRHDNDYHWYSQRGKAVGGQGYAGQGYDGQSGYSGDDSYDWIPNDAWVIVSSNQFMEDNIADIALDPAQNIGLFQNRSFRLNQSAPGKTIIERETRRSVPVTKLDEVNKQVDGKTIKVVTPQKIEPARVKKISKINQNFRPVKNREQPKAVNPQQTKPAHQDNSHPVNRPDRQVRPTTPDKPNQMQQPSNIGKPVRTPGRAISGPDNSSSIKNTKPAVKNPPATMNRPAVNDSGKKQKPANQGVRPQNPNQQQNLNPSPGRNVRPSDNKPVQPQGNAVKNGRQGKTNGKGVRPSETPKPVSTEKPSDGGNSEGLNRN